MAEPPSLGAANVTAAWALPSVATTLVGAPGIVDGITEFEAELEVLLPLMFVATTVKV
jgi:hypothetical protein